MKLDEDTVGWMIMATALVLGIAVTLAIIAGLVALGIVIFRAIA